MATPAEEQSLFESMQKRMAAVQRGEADPGNADIYGYNQTQPGAAGAAPGGMAGGMTGGNMGTPVGTPVSVGDQAKAAQTYSSTPGAAPTMNTSNQGTQDVVRNSWLSQATQSTTVDPNDPNIKQQVDPYAAAQERARRQY